MLELDKIYNRNCFDAIKELPDNSIDLVVTDPPYKVSQNYGGGVDADNLLNVSSILKVFPELCRVLKQSRFLVSFYDNRILPFLFEAIRDTELVYRKSIYLYRRWGNANRWIGWMQCTDPVCFMVKGHDKPFYPEDMKWKIKHDCYIKNKPEHDSTGHPAQKPLEIIEDIVRWCSNPDEIVLDPYLGSGTVAIACRKANRHFIGYEIEKEWYDIAQNRIYNAPLKLEEFQT
jgi:site-specific DNA-methyltransferase (adenine-specific)